MVYVMICAVSRSIMLNASTPAAAVAFRRPGAVHLTSGKTFASGITGQSAVPDRVVSTTWSNIEHIAGKLSMFLEADVCEVFTDAQGRAASSWVLSENPSDVLSSHLVSLYENVEMKGVIPSCPTAAAVVLGHL